MADLPSEGTVQKPYWQNPPRVFWEVHWTGGLAVHFYPGEGPPAPPLPAPAAG